jgi:hypothetical protein
MVGGCDQRVNTASDSIPNPVATIAHSVTGDGWVTVDGTSTAQATVMVSQTNDGRVDGMFELAQVRHLETIFSHFVTEVREYKPQKAICIQKSM